MSNNYPAQRYVLSPRNKTPKLALERVLGLTTMNNSSLAVNPITGEIAYPAGCVVVLYNLRRNKQTRFFRASKSISCLAFSPDGKLLAVGERGHQPAINVWEINTGVLKAELKGHKFGVSCVAFSSKSNMLVSVGFRYDRFLYVWDFRENESKELGKLVGCSKVSQKVHAIEFSKDGKFFVTTGEKHVKFWYLGKEGHVIFTGSRINGVPTIESRVAIMPAHKESTFMSVACGYGTCNQIVYCVTSQGVLCSFGTSRMMERWVSLESGTGFAVSVTEQYIAVACSSGIVRLFNPLTLEYVTTLPLPPALGSANELQVYQEGNPRNRDKVFPDSICIRMTGVKVVVVYSDHTLLIFDIHDASNVGLYRSFLFHSSCIWDLEVSGSADDMDEKGNLKSSDPESIPPGSFITCSSDNTIRLWNLDLHKSKQTRSSKSSLEIDSPVISNWKNPYSKEILRIIYTDDEASSSRKESKPKDELPNPEIPTKPDNSVGIRSISLHPNRRFVASGDKKGNLRVHDILNKRLISIQSAHNAEILCLAHSPADSKNTLLASGSRDRLIHVFDASGKYPLRQTLNDHSSTITSIHFSMDGKRFLSCGGDKTMVLSDVEEGNISRFKSVSVPYGTIYDMDVDATNKYIVTSGQDKRLNIWNISAGKHMRSYKPRTADGKVGELYKVHLDPAGIFVSTCSFDKWIRVFDFYSGECIAKVTGHSELITGIKFSPDCKRLISVSGDGCIFVWRLANELTTAMKDRLAEMSTSRSKNSVGFKKRESTKKVALDRMDSLASLNEDPPEAPDHLKISRKTDLSKAQEYEKKLEERESLYSILDNSLSDSSKKYKVGDPTQPPKKELVNKHLNPATLPDWARTSSVEQMRDLHGSMSGAEREIRDSQWMKRIGSSGYELFGEFHIQPDLKDIEDDDSVLILDDKQLKESNDDVMEESTNMLYYWNDTQSPRLNLKVKSNDLKLEELSGATEERSPVLDEEAETKDMELKFEKAVEQNMKNLEDQIHEEKLGEASANINLRDSFSSSFLKRGSDISSKNASYSEEYLSLSMEDMNINVLDSISSVKSLAQEREQLRLKKRHQETADAVSNMNLKLQELGIIKNSKIKRESKRLDEAKQEFIPDPITLELEEELRASSIELESKNDVNSKSVDADMKRNPELISSISLTSSSDDGKKLSASVNSSVDLKASYSQYLSGYTAEAKLESSSPTKIKDQNFGDDDNVLTSSIASGIHESYSTFTSGYKIEDKITARSSITTSLDVDKLNMSLSNFTSGYTEKENPNRSLDHLPENVSKSLDIDSLKASLSTFTDGYKVEGHNNEKTNDETIKETTTKEENSVLVNTNEKHENAPNKDSSSTSNNTMVSSLNFDPTLSYSNFIDGYKESTEAGNFPSPVKHVNASTSSDSVLTNSMNLDPTISYSNFIGGYHESNRGNTKLTPRTKTAQDTGKSLQLDPSVSLSTFVSGYQVLDNQSNIEETKTTLKSSDPVEISSKKTVDSSIEKASSLNLDFADREVIDEESLSISSPLKDDTVLDQKTSPRDSENTSVSLDSFKSSIRKLNDAFTDALQSYTELKSIASGNSSEKMNESLSTSSYKEEEVNEVISSFEENFHTFSLKLSQLSSIQSSSRNQLSTNTLPDETDQVQSFLERYSDLLVDAVSKKMTEKKS